MSLTDQIALVTGASRGIGRATAMALARAGSDVALTFRSHREEAEEVAAEVRAAGRRALLLQGDVASQQAVEEAVKATVKEFGRLDIAVSNAAFSHRQFLIEADLDLFRRTIDVTMWGAFYMLHAAARQMVAQGKGGTIVIVSSPHAVVAVPRSMAYNMAKAAMWDPLESTCRHASLSIL